MELPESGQPHCMVCGDPMPTTRYALWEIKGYEQDRKAGGTNHVIARERTGRVVGPCCAFKVREGRVGQETLL